MMSLGYSDKSSNGSGLIKLEVPRLPFLAD